MDQPHAALLEGRVQFDLVDGGNDARFVHQPLQVVLAEIRHADGLRGAFVAQLDHGFPRVDEFVLLRAGPVDQQQVDMFAPQPLQAVGEGLLGPVEPLALVPYLRGQEDVAPVADPFANAFLVLVDGGGVHQPVAGFQRGLDRICGIVLLDLPGPEAQLGYLAAVVEGEGGLVGHGFSLCFPANAGGGVNIRRSPLASLRPSA